MNQSEWMDGWKRTQSKLPIMREARVHGLVPAVYCAGLPGSVDVVAFFRDRGQRLVVRAPRFERGLAPASVELQQLVVTQETIFWSGGPRVRDDPIGMVLEPVPFCVAGRRGAFVLVLARAGRGMRDCDRWIEGEMDHAGIL